MTNRLALRTIEVADTLGVHKATVQRWIASGELTAVRVGGCVRVLPVDLDAFLASHREGRDATPIRAVRQRHRTA